MPNLDLLQYLDLYFDITLSHLFNVGLPTMIIQSLYRYMYLKHNLMFELDRSHAYP